MKSRTSFFDKTVLKKNITRFAPVWALYTVLLMMFLGIMAEGSDTSFARSIGDAMMGMAVINLGYALICAQVLFGDLYNSRMCNALYALPLRRETWFFTHVLSGFLFSLVPNLLVTVIALALLPDAMLIPLLWLAASTMQFIFFFGVATLCAHIVGNRFAMALVYAILNFFFSIIDWLLNVIYIPLMYGLVDTGDYFVALTPFRQMVESQWIRVSNYNYELNFGYVDWEIRDGWGYAAICAALGIGLFALALRCCKKRDLEKAGDFVTVKGLDPVFLLIYTMCMGVCFQSFFDLFLGTEEFVFLLIGIVVGFFTGLMLLRRTVRVFRWKTVGACGLVLAAFLGTLWLAELDPMGITRWVPDPEDVEHVSINGDSAYFAREDGTIFDDIRQLEDIQYIHRYAVENPGEGENSASVNIFYQMKNGRYVERSYQIPLDSPAGQLYGQYLSSPQYVLGWVYTGQSVVEELYLGDAAGITYTNPQLIESFLRAVLADCEAGTLPQSWRYTEDAEMVAYAELVTRTEEGYSYYRQIRYTERAENIINWLKAHDITLEKWQ